jgi:hypothetical protein
MQGRRRTRVFIGLATAVLLGLGSTAVSATAAQAATTGTLEGTVKDAATNTAIGGATVSSAGVTATTGADGHYTLTLETGDHTVTATAYGYAAGTASVTIVEGGTTGQDFGLSAAGSVTLSGKITDGSGHGWPLYARLDITGYPGGPVFTNPATGKYTVQIAAGATYSVKVTALIPGYQSVTQPVTVGTANTTANIALPVAPSCTAPGYHGALSEPLLTEPFDGTTAPAGWTVVNRATGGWAFDDPGARGNLTGGAGGFAIADSDHAGSGSTTDTDLISPVLDFSSVPAPQLAFNRLQGHRQRGLHRRRLLHRRRRHLDQRLSPGGQPARPDGRDGAAGRGRRQGRGAAPVPLLRYVGLVVGDRQRVDREPQLHARTRWSGGWFYD